MIQIQRERENLTVISMLSKIVTENLKICFYFTAEGRLNPRSEVLGPFNRGM